MGYRWAAEYYDLFSREDDHDFYMDLSRRAGPRALDIGVGTGRLAIPMARSGISVVGLDNSMEMLRVAHSRVMAAGGGVLRRMKLLYGDMRDFSLPREDRFDLAFAAGDTYNHCMSRAELARAFACVREHLRVGGVFAFDLGHVPDSDMDGRPRLAGVVHLKGDGELVRHVAWLPGSKKGHCEVHITFERFDRRGRSDERIAERSEIHLFEPTEVAELLHLGGFEEVERYCDHHGGRSAGRGDRLAVYTCLRGP